MGNVLRSRRSALPASLRIARPPLTLTGPLLLVARILWTFLASGALVLRIVEIPLYHHAALQLHNTRGPDLGRHAWVGGGAGVSGRVIAGVSSTG